MTTQPTQEAPMSDVTDLNALVERAELQARASAASFEVCQTLDDCAKALRTLAERQPVGEKRIVALGRIAQAYERDDEAHAFDKALDAAYHAGRQSVTDQAAEQRDRAFEEAAGIAENYRTRKFAKSGKEISTRFLIAAAIRQRIGGQ